MPKKQKYPRLPNGWGSIRHFTGTRKNPFGVYPPQLDEDIDGRRLPVKALCYVPSWSVGFAVLCAYKAGRYTPGMEHDLIRAEAGVDPLDAETLNSIFADYMRIRRTALNQPEEDDPTFAEVYDAYYKDKYETGKSYSVSSRNATSAAYKQCKAIHEKRFRDLTLDDLQSIIDTCQQKHATKELILALLRGVYHYAALRSLCDIDYSQHLVIKTEDDDDHGVPFTDDEMRILWANKSDPVVEMILIMCYAGYRISAYRTIEVNLKSNYFIGGNKTASGKHVQCPIHSATRPLVALRLKRDGALLSVTPAAFRKYMYAKLEALGIEKHTPHDCKHTFSALCEKYGVNENDRKRMLGHKIGNVTNDIYGHRTLEELRAEIEKIKVPV